MYGENDKKDQELSEMELQAIGILPRHLFFGHIELKSEKIPEEKPDVIFVGGGPTGILGAISAMLYAREYKKDLVIWIFEKREAYVRNHVLRIKETTFHDAHPDEAFQKLLSEVSGKIEIKVLEKKLKDFATNLGIKFKYEKIESGQDIAARYPECSLIVGSDGAHSTIRKTVFGDKLAVNDNLKHVAIVKYQVKGATKPLPILDHITTLFGKAHYFITETIGKENKELSAKEDKQNNVDEIEKKQIDEQDKEQVDKQSKGQSTVTLQMFINKETYLRLEKLGRQNFRTLSNRTIFLPI